ncbi:MAG: cbb3-type cytochrome c oxidase subunit I [Mariprofundaceae bacterium]|nr:cbb3-type cytochrome c oxidase subunit I [Mariprofundaceae bacterium]
MGQPKTWKEWIFTLDHKIIGIFYLAASLVSFLVAGTSAALMRIELGSLGPTLTEDAGVYNLWLTMHGAVMILGFQIPALLGFFANWVVPIMIGAKDMAFPRVNALSVWLLWSGILLALCNLIVPDSFNGMWTGYPPYSETDFAGNTALYSLIIIVLGISSVFGAVNLACTVMFMRARGIGWYQLNMTVWCVFTANIMQLIFVPVLAASVLLLSLDKYLGFGFYDPGQGGDVLLYQNLFWFYSHPAVYVVLLPFLGISFDIIATFARNRIFNYKVAVWATLAFIPVSSDVWVHHAFVAGLPNWLRTMQTFTTLMISLPFGLLMLSMVMTLYKGSIEYRTPMHWIVGMFFMLIIGATTGIPNALSAIDYGISDSYVIMSHFHYVMAISGAMAIFGGIYYYFPKLTGRMYSEAMGKISAWLFFIGMNVVMGPLYFIGIEGMPRRYYDYQMFPQFESMHALATVGVVITTIGVLIMLYSWLHGMFRGEKATANPWQSQSLEFTHTDVIPGPGNFPTPPVMPEGWSPYSYDKTVTKGGSE